MKLEIATIIFAGISSAATVFIAYIAHKQLSKIIDQVHIQGEREKKWKTLAVCEQYDIDPVLNEHNEAIYTASKSGTDFTEMDHVKHQMINFFNYLEGLATGIRQGVYVEEIIYDHFNLIIYKSVKSILKGESGSTPNGVWVSKNPALNRESYFNLMELYEKWYPNKTETSYQDT